MTNTRIIALVAAIVGLAIYGAYLYPKFDLTAGSSAGTTFSNAKFAGVVVTPSVPGVGATSTSILNSDASDRFVTFLNAGCKNNTNVYTAYTGAGLTSLGWTLTVGTSSTSGPADVASVGAFSRVGNAVPLATTSDYVLSTSTQLISTSTIAMRWKSGEYMTFWLNATSSATCTFGVDYIAN